MRSRTSPDLAGRCPRCWLPEAACLCADIPRLETRVELLIVRHVKESWRTTNSARLAELALPRCRILDYGAQDAPLDPAEVLGPETWLLYPGAGPVAHGAPRRLVVLDGSWSQSRRMFRRIPGLSALPRLSLAPPVAPVVRLRQPPQAEGRATLEAIAAAMAQIEDPSVGEALARLYDGFVARYREVAYGPDWREIG